MENYEITRYGTLQNVGAATRLE
ncbi:hypothetical protein ACLBXM_06640 [Xanthobacteraceae bacterium A53D]